MFVLFLDVYMVIVKRVKDEDRLKYSLRDYTSGDFFPEGNYTVYEEVTDLAENHVSNTFSIYVEPGKVIIERNMYIVCLRWTCTKT